ncbi:MAG: Na(+)-translocating NADH-quinone reductase subunit C [Oceanicoccus sp.]|uniref:Na(+)-translocating NADH-quinone reductase subunit C n=1 Tax=Oceanicoccus sp. TaxID=2691044 RepID=UPI00262CE507|nr:Na(+)-translocating NADH-quinone reductase subunit C [Oceanicoccus sp.]MCP3907900.1 Na(+)-translocating NADH-quinone reductase subunit C [Oceanicoccus sp.]MDG1773285.1 Na(+)-translocating NADH-quinone reductase subunit C [Oceanicoccus sp.]
MANKETTSKTIIVALVLCIVCSLVVSSAAVLLKDQQDANKKLDRYSNILAAAGMLNKDESIEDQYNRLITARVVDLETGRYTDVVDVATYDQRRAVKDNSLSEALSGEDDLAKISRRENYSMVYLVLSKGELQKIILPVRGYGLWSTMRGFIALENDGNTIAGLGFSEHGETPGLGGEIDNPKWKSLWPGKKVYQNGEVEVGLIKGSVTPGSANADYEVDGLAGATLTSRGVTNLVHFWLGEKGFQKFLSNLRSGEAG